MISEVNLPDRPVLSIATSLISALCQESGSVPQNQLAAQSGDLAATTPVREAGGRSCFPPKCMPRTA